MIILYQYNATSLIPRDNIIYHLTVGTFSITYSIFYSNEQCIHISYTIYKNKQNRRIIFLTKQAFQKLILLLKSIWYDLFTKLFSRNRNLIRMEIDAKKERKEE